MLAAAVSACGGSSTSPSSTAPRVTGITPRAASISGGVTVTISGANFAVGASVTIGGAAATDVAVASASSITARAPAHAAGPADVVVTVNGQAASLPGGLLYVVNALPVISSVVVKGQKPREPTQFADLDETVSVSAAVTDAETPVSQLTFMWSADAGTFSGTGSGVTWTAPHTFATPANVILRLTVTERFEASNNAGGTVSGENTVGTSTTVRLHDSAKEVGDLAVDFLTAFSQQLNPDYVIRNFTTSCSGTPKERADVAGNQQDVVINFYKLGTADTIVGFTGRCLFRDEPGDACAFVPAEWHSYIKGATYKPEYAPHIGQTQIVTGTDQVTAVLENDQWKLCDSAWDQATSMFLSREGRRPIEASIRFKR